MSVAVINVKSVRFRYIISNYLLYADLNCMIKSILFKFKLSSKFRMYLQISLFNILHILDISTYLLTLE